MVIPRLRRIVICVGGKVSHLKQAGVGRSYCRNLSYVQTVTSDDDLHQGTRPVKSALVVGGGVAGVASV